MSKINSKLYNKFHDILFNKVKNTEYTSLCIEKNDKKYEGNINLGDINGYVTLDESCYDSYGLFNPSKNQIDYFKKQWLELEYNDFNKLCDKFYDRFDDIEIIEDIYYEKSEKYVSEYIIIKFKNSPMVYRHKKEYGG